MGIVTAAYLLVWEDLAIREEGDASPVGFAVVAVDGFGYTAANQQEKGSTSCEVRAAVDAQRSRTRTVEVWRARVRVEARN